MMFTHAFVFCFQKRGFLLCVWWRRKCSRYIVMLLMCVCYSRLPLIHFRFICQCLSSIYDNDDNYDNNNNTITATTLILQQNKYYNKSILVFPSSMFPFASRQFSHDLFPPFIHCPFSPYWRRLSLNNFRHRKPKNTRLSKTYIS